MTYQLFDENDEPAVDIPCDDIIEAQEWALNWARSKASADHYLVRHDGKDTAQLFHAAGGQWYWMSR